MKELSQLPLQYKVKGGTGKDGVYHAHHPWIEHYFIFITVSTTGGWEHIMAVLKQAKKGKGREVKSVPRMLTHEELALLKDLFFEPEEVTVIFQPAGMHYIANQVNVSHIWKPTELPLPVPTVVLQALKENPEPPEESK